MTKMNFPDALYDFKSQWKSADNFWQFGAGQHNPYRIALIVVLALRKVKVSSHFKTKDVSIFSHKPPLFSLHWAVSSIWSLRCTLPSSDRESDALVCTSDTAEMWGSAYLQAFSASNLALTQSSCLEKCSGQCWVEARGIWRILLCVTLLPFFFFPDLLNVPFMSVSGEPPACELVRLFCSTRASACPAPASAWPSARGGIDASVRIPVGWSSPWGHSRSCTCFRAGAAGVPGHALCRCPANNLVFSTGWLSF